MPAHPRLRVGLAILTAAACCVPLLTVASTTTAGADTPDCTYTPVLPSRVVVKQDVVGLKVPVKVSGGAECSANFNASIHLVHGRDSFLLNWDETSTTDNESVYAFEVVAGAYNTAAPDCMAYSADFETTYTCSVEPASTVIKFAQHVRIKAARHHKLVSISVVTYSYSAFGNKRIGDTVSIQRQRSNGSWTTIHTGKTTSKRGYVWTYRYAGKATYRAMSTETKASFGGTSLTVRR